MKRLYNIIVTLAALTTVAFVVLDFCGKISLTQQPYYIIDTLILLFFTADYAVRFFCSDDRKKFFKSNVFDLIAIIPFNAIFQAFRIFRVFRLAKLTRLAKFSRVVRAVAFLEVVKRKINGILHTNGLIYILYINAALVIISSVIISYTESMSFGDALWWSIVTCTTVGYGDISPSTTVGRVVAVILMLFGIGLIGMLTGAITTFFTQRDKQPADENDINELFGSLSEAEKKKVIEIIKIMKE